ncbi:unnamed protein product [Phyllotreta striolata]|uniref:Uncharacterized protein n=1 Tax=Phyllotreta striolata TaxID=444603 RepID=A0A9N9THY2_PHYSR|nr:unnamed protein product [Phyllotreta striolata]
MRAVRLILITASADYSYYYDYQETSQDAVDIPGVADYEKTFTIPRINNKVTITAERGDIVELSCNPTDLGGCEDRFLKKNGNPAGILEDRNVRIRVENSVNYTCGCKGSHSCKFFA